MWQVIKLLHIFKQTGTLTSLLWLIHLYFEKILFCIPVDLIQSKHCNNYNTLHSWGGAKNKKLHISLNQPTYKQYTTIQVWQIKISVQCIMCMAWEKIHSSPWQTEGGCFSPLCRSCLLGRCCGSACSCPCRWRGSCGWSSADARRGWPGSCMGAGGKGRSRSELSGDRWRAEGKWEREEEFSVCANSENRLVNLFQRPHPVNLDDLELLRDISRVGRQPGPARDEPQEKHPLLIGELLQALPKPANELVALGDVTVTHQLLQHLDGDLR